MGKMKEMYMQLFYPNGIDLEREYLLDDSLVKSQKELEIQELMAEIHKMNLSKSKIEVKDEQRTDSEIIVNNKDDQKVGNGF